MEQHDTPAGARIRMTIEGVVRDSYQAGLFTLANGTSVTYTPGDHPVTVLAPGWEPGDVVETEHGVLIRRISDGYAHWRRRGDGAMFHDDQVRPDRLKVVSRATPAPEQPAAPAVDHAARWHAVEALVTRARDKGVTQIDTDLLAQALGLDEAPQPPACRAPGSPSCACASDEYRFCGASLGRSEPPYTCNRRVAHLGACSPDLDKDEREAPDEEADGVGPHDFEAQHMTESDAKRRLPNCRWCKQPATAAAHDGDQSEETRHLRMLLNA